MALYDEDLTTPEDSETTEIPAEAQYPVGENGYPVLEELVLRTDDQLELIDGFLTNRFGSEYISAKLALAHKRNQGE